MLGTSHTVRGGRTAEYEFLRIFERGAGLVYEAHPSGQQMNQFQSVEITASSITFSDPDHDFPQRIVYTRVGIDSVVARVSGAIAGETRSIEFAFARVSCDLP